MIKRLLNVGLSGGGLAGKFILLFLLARLLTPGDFGTYGIIAATLSYCLYLVGLDFYTFAGREMAQTNRQKWPSMLRDQGVLYIFSYLVVIPQLGLLFWFNILPKELAVVFFILLVSEHLSLEYARTLVTLGRPIASGVLMFVRTGTLGYALIYYYINRIGEIELFAVVWAWAGIDMIALCLGVLLLRKLPWAGRNRNVDWPWIIKGIRVALLLLIGTLALRGIFTIDRYFIDMVSGREMLGVYTLYLGISSGLIGLLDAAVFSFNYPKLISIYKRSDIIEFGRAKFIFFWQTILTIIVMSSVALLLIKYALHWVGKPVYLEQISIFYLLLTASSIFGLGHVPHYVLYAMGRDRSIVVSNTVGFVSFIIFSVIFGYLYKMTGVALAMILSATITGATKQYSTHSGNSLVDGQKTTRP